MQAETRTFDATIVKARTFAGSRVIDLDAVDERGKALTLGVPKGGRGFKEGATVRVRVERRDWYEITRVRIGLGDGTLSESSERGEYHDGARDHYYLEGLA